MENTMGERKWEEMNRDCLIHIISKVKYTDDLLDSIPFVCKSWYNATLDPKCWQVLVFPEGDVSTEYIKLVVGRSQRSAVELIFQGYISIDGFVYISDECSMLKVLYLSQQFIIIYSSKISELIGKFNDLEFFGTTDALPLHAIYCAQPNVEHFETILESISIHCPNFRGLSWQTFKFPYKYISSIIKFLPKLKLLDISYGTLSKNDIVMLLKGCKELENFQAIDCIGFNGDDDEIKKLASNIQSFNCSGSILSDFLEDLSNNYNRICNDYALGPRENLNVAMLALGILEVARNRNMSS